jgi:hypothetical protein
VYVAIELIVRSELKYRFCYLYKLRKHNTNNLFLRKIIKPNSWRVPQITLMLLYVFILSEYRIHAQVANYGSFYVPAGASVSLPTTFINNSSANFENNGTIYVGADFENNQSFLNSGAGTTHFVGVNTQSLGGSSSFFVNNFTLNKTNFLQLNNSLSIAGNLRFEKGFITTSQLNLLTLESTAAITGTPGIYSFINGPLLWKTNAVKEYRFPVGILGSEARYLPASVYVTEITGTTNFQVEVAAANPTFSPYGNNFIDPTLNALMSDKYWNINKNGNAKARVKLNYQGNDAEVNWTPLDPSEGSKVAVAQWNPQKGEETEGNWSFTKSGDFNFSIAPFFESRLYNSVGPVYSGEIEEFTTFTIGHSKSQILPVRLLTFDVLLQNNDQAFLKWTVLNDKEVKDFVVQHSVDGLHFSELAFVVGRGANPYSYVHKSLSSGTHYYKILIREVNGSSFNSAIKHLVVKSSATYIKGLRETVVASRAIPILFSSDYQNITYSLLDASGRVFKTQQLKAQKGFNEWTIEMGHLASGAYFVHITTQDGITGILRLIKTN